jgi:hypothetical protein
MASIAETKELIMTVHRRAFMAAAAATAVVPSVAASREVPKAGMDWQTM